MLRRHTALDLGQKSVWERNPPSQTEISNQNNRKKQKEKNPTVFLRKPNTMCVKASKELRGKQKTTKSRSYLTVHGTKDKLA